MSGTETAEQTIDLNAVLAMLGNGNGGAMSPAQLLQVQQQIAAQLKAAGDLKSAVFVEQVVPVILEAYAADGTFKSEKFKDKEEDGHVIAGAQGLSVGFKATIALPVDVRNADGTVTPAGTEREVQGSLLLRWSDTIAEKPKRSGNRVTTTRR